MLQHKISSTPIYFTNDYSRFVFINGNRDVDERRVKKMIKDVESGNDQLRYYPIKVKEVNDKLEIDDGQHRFTVCERQLLPVFYVIDTEKRTLYNIASVNSNVGKWKNKDFIKCYDTMENSNYLQLKEFMTKYKPVNISISIKLLYSGNPGSAGGPGRKLGDLFMMGEFEVKEQAAAEKLMDNAKRFSKFRFWHDRAFLIAIYKLLNGSLVSFDTIVEAFEKFDGLFVRQSHERSYIKQLDNIYNINSRSASRITIYQETKD